MPLDSIISVVALAPGAVVTLAHGLSDGQQALKPNFVAPDRATPIGVSAVTSTSVSFTNWGNQTESAFFHVKRDHSVQQAGGAELFWQGSAGLTSFKLTEPQWTDLLIPDTSLRNGVSAPSLTVFSGGIRLNAYSEGNEAYLVTQMPHDWVEGSTIKPHVHCSFPDANLGNFVWGFEYLIASPALLPAGGAFTGMTIETASTAAPALVREHHIVALPDIAMVGKTLSSIIMARVFRKAGVAGPYGSAIFLLHLDLHYQRDALGSRTEYIK